MRRTWGSAIGVALIVSAAAIPIARFADGAGAPEVGAARGPHLYPTVDQAEARRAARAAGRAFQLRYAGGRDGIGVTTGPPQVYVVFWGAQWGTASPPGSTNFSNDAAGVANRVVALLAGIGTNGEQWSGVMTQYCEGAPPNATICPVDAPHIPYPTGGVLAGVWADTAVAAPTTATASQIALEAIAAAAHFGNTTPESNRNAQYVVVSATGTHPDHFNAPLTFCAWHGFAGDPFFGVTSPYGDIAFTNLPYMPDADPRCGQNFVNPGPAGAIDGVTIVEGHEYAETITDQTLGAWIDDRGQENADKCAWVAVGPGAAQNVAFATGSFAMQSTWSNDGAACLIAHPTWGPGGVDDFALLASPDGGVTDPGGSVQTTVGTFTTSGQPQSLLLSVSGLPDGATASFDPPAILADESATLTVATAADTPFGTYDIAVTATGPTATHVVTFTVLVRGAPVSPLTSGVPVFPSGATGSDTFWYLDVPAQQTVLLVTLEGESGDADVSVRKGDVPTPLDADCESSNPGSYEECQRFQPDAARWYVKVHAFQSFADVRLTATYVYTQFLGDGLRLENIAGAAGSHHYWFAPVLPGTRQLRIAISGARGDADLSLRFGKLPTLLSSACRPNLHSARGHSEKCTIRNPVAGTWYVDVAGFTDFTRLRLRARIR
jgi:serine protease